MYNICITIRVTCVVQRRCINYNIMYTRATRFGCIKTGTDFIASRNLLPRDRFLLFHPPAPLHTHNNVIMWPANSNNGDVGHMVRVMESHVCDYSIYITPVINKIFKKNQFIIAFLERSPIDRWPSSALNILYSFLYFCYDL